MEVEGREVLFGRGCAILYRERPFDWASAVERPVKRLLALAGIYAAYSRKLTQNMRICVRCALILSARLGKRPRQAGPLQPQARRRGGSARNNGVSTLAGKFATHPGLDLYN